MEINSTRTEMDLCTIEGVGKDAAKEKALRQLEEFTGTDIHSMSSSRRSESTALNCVE